jgi:hypothetical protein
MPSARLGPLFSSLKLALSRVTPIESPLRWRSAKPLVVQDIAVYR